MIIRHTDTVRNAAGTALNWVRRHERADLQLEFVNFTTEQGIASLVANFEVDHTRVFKTMETLRLLQMNAAPASTYMPSMAYVLGTSVPDVFDDGGYQSGLHLLLSLNGATFNLSHLRAKRVKWGWRCELGFATGQDDAALREHGARLLAAASEFDCNAIFTRVLAAPREPELESLARAS